MSISQLDLILLGQRALTARLSGVESSVRGLTLLGTVDANGSSFEAVRPNLLENASFEFYQRGQTTAERWAFGTGATLLLNAPEADGSVVAQLTAGASVSQVVSQGASLAKGAIVLSVAARTSYTGQNVTLDAYHTPGITWGAVYRLDVTGAATQTSAIPSDGQWYRFFRQGTITGGGQLTAVIGYTGSGTI